MLALTIGALLPAYHLALIGDNLNGSRILALFACDRFLRACARIWCRRSGRWLRLR